MKLEIEKVPSGVKVTINHDVEKAPVVFVLKSEQIQALAGLLETVKRGDIQSISLAMIGQALKGDPEFLRKKDGWHLSTKKRTKLLEQTTGRSGP